MKNLLFVCVLFFTVVSHGQNWQTSFSEAKEKAKTTDKPLILVFSGSDWCAPCIKLEKDIWQSEVFTTYAASNYILYRADFPRRKANKLSEVKERENKELAEIYNSKGHFPLVVILDTKLEIVGKTGYKKVKPKEYISILKNTTP